eukprot:m.1203260 g.1203260  ORF g.1203260 m.1203260 type:complete len:96 (-) comp24578_c0_seq11:428-715(-)
MVCDRINHESIKHDQQQPTFLPLLAPAWDMPSLLVCTLLLRMAEFSTVDDAKVPIAPVRCVFRWRGSAQPSLGQGMLQLQDTVSLCAISKHYACL